MMVDDDHIGVERVLARLQHEAFLVERTVRAQTIVAGRCDERPDRRVLAHVPKLGAIAQATACAIASCCARNRNAGNERDKTPPSPKIDASVASVEVPSPSARTSTPAAITRSAVASVWGKSNASALFLVTFGLLRRGGVFLDDRNDLADPVDAYPKIVVGLGDAGLVFVVRFAGLPFQFDEGVEPEFLKAAHALDGLRGDRRLTKGGLIRARDVELLLVD